VCSRACADALFRQALMDDGEPWWRAWIMWAGVRLGGLFAWKNNQQGGWHDFGGM